MRLASFSRLALVGATMFSLIGADASSGPDADNIVEKKDTYGLKTKSLQGSECQSHFFNYSLYSANSIRLGCVTPLNGS